MQQHPQHRHWRPRLDWAVSTRHSECDCLHPPLTGHCRWAVTDSLLVSVWKLDLQQGTSSVHPAEVLHPGLWVASPCRVLTWRKAREALWGLLL